MRVDIKTSGFDLTGGRDGHIDKCISFAFDRATSQVSMGAVKLVGINGLRGGMSQGCPLHISLTDLSDMVVEKPDGVEFDRFLNGLTSKRRM